jgi:hypothetical protein
MLLLGEPVLAGLTVSDLVIIGIAGLTVIMFFVFRPPRPPASPTTEAYKGLPNQVIF